MRVGIRRFLARVNAARRGHTLDKEFELEIDTHLALLVEDNMRRGMTRDEAERAARRRFGGAEGLKAQHRDVRGLPSLENLWQDLRFAVRLTIKEKWFSAAAVTALAIGIGANATGFSIINAAILRGLPFDEAARICEVWWRTSSGRASVAYADVAAWRAATQTVELAAFSDGSMNISDETGLPEQVNGVWITPNLFGLLRQRVLLGRDFVAGEDAFGAHPVVIIGHRLWTTRYGADAGILGKGLRLNGRDATIVGVMPEGMKFPEIAEIWAPLVPAVDDPDESVTALARLQDGVDLHQAGTELSTIALRSAAASDRTRDFVGVHIDTFGIGGRAKAMFATVMAAVGFVLLIACANVANLLLSRSAFRAREIAMRIAVGASRARMVRQLLIESFVLALLGGIAGAWIATFGTAAFERALGTSQKPYWLVFTVDGAVLAYVAAICVVTTFLFGLAPALHVSGGNSHAILKDSGRTATIGQRLRGFSSTMIVLELALTLVLLGGAGLVVRSFATLYAIDLGIDTSKLITMELDLPSTRYPTAESRWRFLQRVHSRVTALPGVQAATLTTGVPPLDGGERMMEIDSQPGPSAPRFVSTVAVTPDFFTVVDRELLGGRRFSEIDGAPGTAVVIVNERLAQQFFPGENPIGRRLRFTERNPKPDSPVDGWRTIVGVSPSIRHGSPTDAYISSVVYLPYRQDAPAEASLLVRTAVTPESVMEAVRREVRAEDHDQPVYGLRTIDQLLEDDRWMYRAFGGLFSILAVASLLLSAVGLYAVMAYAVSSRTHEIGVRIALGANRRTVSLLILKRAIAQLAIGLPIGIAGALAFGRLLRGLLVEMSPSDPTTLGAVACLLISVALAACLVPAYRAMRVDPVLALRSD